MVGEYVDLKQAGKSYKGKSPFTNEKTPSFYVSPERGMYYCFSSQKGGDIFTFIQEMEGVDFKGALKILADRAHIELVAEDPHVRDERDTQYALLETATEYFFRTREQYPLIGEYIGARGVKAQTIHTWRIGYAKDEWRALKTYLSERGFTEAQMYNAGLIKHADGGKEPYDVFRNRIMFPIMDTSGRVVAFSGRTLKTEAGVPKYVNSPETELFQKSEILYGYDKAKHSIRHYDFALVVEGQFDLVLAHQAGYTNTVAVSGTALTTHHIMLLMRLSKNVVLALDADRAGMSAVKRVAAPLLTHGMDVKVAHLPEGQDPADVVRTDPQELKHIVGRAVHVIEFLLTVLSLHTKDERTYKLRVREEIIPLLVAIDNRIDREHFEGVIAERLGTTKEGIHFEVERHIEALKYSNSDLQHERSRSAPEENTLAHTKTHNRKKALEQRITTFLAVLVEERLWIQEVMRTHLTYILTETDCELFFSKVHTERERGDIFILEEYIESVSERQLLEEISDLLTQFAQLVARERLSVLREELRRAETEKDDERVLGILANAKMTEDLLQKTISVTRT